MKLVLENFKAHRHTEIEFGRFTVLIGPNGVGKTTVLEALLVLKRLVAASYGNKLSEVLSEWELDLDLDSMKRNNKGFQVSLSESTKLGTYGLKFDYEHLPGVAEFNWYCKEPYIETEGRDLPIDSAYLRNLVTSVVLYQFDAAGLSQPSYSSDIVPALSSDGYGLASVMAYLKLTDDESFGHIQSSLRRIVPGFNRLHVRPARVARAVERRITIDNQALSTKAQDEVIGHALRFEMKGAPDLPASSISEGTLVVLGILTALHAPNRPRLLLLDDIERGLHPKAQRELVGLLRKLLDQNPDLRIIATTHSPYIVDALPPEDVWVLAPDAEGAAVAKRLTDHPRAAQDLKMLTAGEFWSAEGEAWVTQTPEQQAGK